MLRKNLSLKISFLGVLRESLIISLFISILSLSSQIKLYLPYSPVPVTLQTLIVFLGVAFLKEKALLSEAIWIILSLMGVPLFSQGGGFHYLFAPTWGYILGFLLASLLLLKVLSFRETLLWYIFSFSLANIIIYILGVIGLKLSLGVSILEAFLLGVLPFLYGDCLKIVLASLITRLVRFKVKPKICLRIKNVS